MRIYYVSNSRIPTEKAYGIQIMKMCEAFSSQNIDAHLIIPTRKGNDIVSGDPYEYYSVKENFHIKKLWTIDPYFLMKMPQGIYIKFQSFFFMMSLCIFLFLSKV